MKPIDTTVCLVTFNTKHCAFYPQCILVSRMFITINDSPLCNTDQSVVLMETHRVLCEVRSGYLHTESLFNARPSTLDKTIS